MLICRLCSSLLVDLDIFTRCVVSFYCAVYGTQQGWRRTRNKSWAKTHTGLFSHPSTYIHLTQISPALLHIYIYIFPFVFISFFSSPGVTLVHKVWALYILGYSLHTQSSELAAAAVGASFKRNWAHSIRLFAAACCCVSFLIIIIVCWKGENLHFNTFCAVAWHQQNRKAARLYAS